MPAEDPHLRLAGVTRLSLHGRGPASAFVFDPHRLALPCWALALEERAPDGPPALLLTFDRHLDLVPPRDPAAVPDRTAGMLALDGHARQVLDVRNVDHVLAAMEARLIGDVVAIARARPRGTIAGDHHLDRAGRRHAIHVAPALDAFLAREQALRDDVPILLDIDLDCFTTPCDADPSALVPWPLALIREHLMPEGSAPFWDAVLARTVALTVAREPYHCGGLVASGRLFEDAARVIFCELLGADLP